MPDDTAARVLRTFVDQLTKNEWTDLGHPGARDLRFDDPAMIELLTSHLLNNHGDPYVDGNNRCHTKQLEREVLAIVAGYLNAPDGFWGYVTSGASEAVAHCTELARDRWHEQAIVYASELAHISVFKAAQRFRLPSVMIPATTDGQMNLRQLGQELRRRRERPAMIVTTVGTTMEETRDDVAAIAALCRQLAIRRLLYVDAALAGLPLSLAPHPQHPFSFDFSVGADAIAVSGHKFVGVLEPCAVLLYAQHPYATRRETVSYTGTVDSTVNGSRSGHTVAKLWWALSAYDADVHRQRAEDARHLAVYTHDRLRAMGWPAQLAPLAFTVVLRTPPPQVCAKWTLGYSSTGELAHIVCMPGVVQAQIDDFLSNLEASLHLAPDEQPAQRRLSRQHQQVHLSTVGSTAGAADP